jgi:vacuolar-type H+-ATPase subunit I/STV1
MVNSVSNSSSTTQSLNKQTNSSNLLDIHNASLNDVKKVLGNMYKNGDVSIKDMLPFLNLHTERLSRDVGQEVHVQYYGEVWEKPNQKRDMLAAYENILSEQMANNESIDKINSTKKAIELLKSIDKNTHASKFSEALNSNTEKPLEEYRMSTRITQDVASTYSKALNRFDEEQRTKITSSLISLKEVDNEKYLSDKEIVDFQNLSTRVNNYLNTTNDNDRKVLVENFWKEFNKLYSPNNKFNDVSVSSQEILQLKQSLRRNS